MEQKKKPGEGTSLAPAVAGSTSRIFGVRTLEYDTRRAAEALEAAKSGGPVASPEVVAEVVRPVAPPPEPKVSTWKPKPIPKPAEPTAAETRKISIEADLSGILEMPRQAPAVSRPKAIIDDAGFLDNILKEEFEEIKKAGKPLPTPMPVVPRPKHLEEEFKTPGRIVVPQGAEAPAVTPPVAAPPKPVAPPQAAIPPKAAPSSAAAAPAPASVPRQVSIATPVRAAAPAQMVAPVAPPAVKKTGPSSDAPTPAPGLTVPPIPAKELPREPAAVRPAPVTPPPSIPVPKPAVPPPAETAAPRAQILSPSQAIPPPVAPKQSVRPPMPGAPSVPSRPGVRVLEGLPTFDAPTPTKASMKVDTFSFPKMSSTAPAALTAPAHAAVGTKLPPPPAPPRRAVPIKPGAAVAPKPVQQAAQPVSAPVAPQPSVAAPPKPAAPLQAAIPPQPAPASVVAPAPPAPPSPAASVSVAPPPPAAAPVPKAPPAPLQPASPQAPRPQVPPAVPPPIPAPVAPVSGPVPQNTPREETVGGEIVRLGKEVEAIELKRREIESRMAKLFVERSAIERELAPVMESVRAAAKALEESEAAERAALQTGGEVLRKAEEARYACVEEKHAKDEARWAIQERLEAVLTKITAEETAYAEEGKRERAVYDRIHALETEVERKKLAEDLAKVSAERGSVESRLSALANERSRIGILLKDLLAKEATIEQQAKAADPGDGGRRAVAQEKLIAEARYRLEKERHAIELERWKTEEALSHVHGSVTDSEKALASIRSRENLIATKLKQLGGS